MNEPENNTAARRASDNKQEQRQLSSSGLDPNFYFTGKQQAEEMNVIRTKVMRIKKATCGLIRRWPFPEADKTYLLTIVNVALFVTPS